MLSIARLQSVEHAMNYYEDDNYYCKEEEKGYTQWYGRGAENLGLNGKIKVHDFHFLLRGYAQNRQQLVQSKDIEQKVSFEKYFKFKKSFQDKINESKLNTECKGKILEVIDEFQRKRDKISSEMMAKKIKKINSIVNQSNDLDIESKQELKKNLKKDLDIFSKSVTRRPAYDLTFSAPKSVSLIALVEGNQDLIHAHREAVQYALSVVENEYSRVTRIDSEKNRRVQENSGNIVTATFEHDVSRKLDPQLHTHCVVMNLTKHENKWRALNSDGFFYNSKKIGAIYQNFLAHKVKDLGYDIKLNPNGTFEIKGYREDEIRHFSKRSEQLKELGASNQKEATKLVKFKRDKKIKEESRTHLKKSWKEDCLKLNIIHPEPLKNKILNIHNHVDFEKIVQDSIGDLTQNDVTFRKDTLELSVLTKTIGTYSYENVRNYVDNYLSKNAHQVGEFKNNEFVSNESLDVEKKTIEMLKRGKNLFESIVTKEESKRIIHGLDEKSKSSGHAGLNKGQTEAIELLLTSNDRVFCWEGVAGSGKTFSLYSATRIALEQGYKIKALAPGSDAAKNLASEAKLEESATVASILVQSSNVNDADGKQLWVVDEAGMLSAQDAYALLRKAEIENARILLVGDTRQLSAVGAGNPFKQLQAVGMQTAQLTQGLRQKDLTMQEAVNLIADDKHTKGLEILEKNGKVFEQDKDAIINSIALDYLSLYKDEVKESLFISSTNYEKNEITNLIRSELKKRHELKDEFKAPVFVSRDINEFNLRYSGVYEKGDILVLNKRSQGLKANIPYGVIEVNNVQNTITILNGNKNKIVNLGNLKANLYREESMEICIGDRIKWTKNQTAKGHFLESNEKINKRLNGQYLTVTEIDAQKRTAVVQYENGKKEEISLNNPNFIDYSYVTTVFSSQGRTCEKVYASLTNIDKENFYVAVSRAKNDCKLYTHDKDEVYKKIDKSGANETALYKTNSTKENFDLELELKNGLSTKKEEKTDRKISESFLESIKIERKIREKSFEVIYNLKLDPSGNECGHLIKAKEKNYDFICKEINSEINTFLLLKDNQSRSKLDINILKNTYENKINEISKKVQNNLFNRMNNKNEMVKLNQNFEKFHHFKLKR